MISNKRNLKSILEKILDAAETHFTINIGTVELTKSQTALTLSKSLSYHTEEDILFKGVFIGAPNTKMLRGDNKIGC